MDVLSDDAWPAIFKEKPEVFTREQKREWLDKLTDVSLGSDAFFPFGDNIERAHRSGVKYVAQPGGSVRDDNVIETCNKYGMVMSFTGIRSVPSLIGSFDTTLFPDSGKRVVYFVEIEYNDKVEC